MVIDTHKGEDLNQYVPIFKKCGLPVLYNFKPADMKWVPYEPKAQMLALHFPGPGQQMVPRGQQFGGGIRFLGREDGADPLRQVRVSRQDLP